jgi:hypothetical protein
LFFQTRSSKIFEPGCFNPLITFSRAPLIARTIAMNLAHLKSTIAVSAGIALSCALPQAASAQEPLTCEGGPLTKVYGRGLWLAYGCSDGHSLALVAALGNGARPYRYMLKPQGPGYAIVGEGAGNKNVAVKAWEALVMLPSADIQAIVDEANGSKKGVFRGWMEKLLK